MRIALLHYTCPPVPGGVERIIGEHARLLAKHGHEVTVLCGEGGETWPAGVRLELLPGIRRAAGATLDDATKRRLREVVQQQGAVFLHNVLTMPFHLPLTHCLRELAETATRTRFIAWVHDVAAVNPDYAPVAEVFRSAPARIEYVAVSERRRGELCAATGLADERCRVIPNGIDPLERLRLTPAVRRLAEDWQILERKVVVLHPSRLLRRKNVETSLRVTAALTAEPQTGARPPLLLITGAADPHNAASEVYARELRDLARQLELVSTDPQSAPVCWVSDQFDPTDADVDSLYALADALLYPSHQEGFGLPLLEAALHRIPIFCRDAEPLASLLPPGNLTLFSERTLPVEIAAILMRQLEASDTIRNRKEAVRRYGWSSVYHNFLAPLLTGTETLTSS